MRALIPFAMLLAAGASGAIVDRVAVVVGDKVITDSEIDLRIRLSAFQNDQKAEFSLAARRQAAQELIDQRLVEHEMDIGHYPRLQEPARRDLLNGYAKTNYKSEAEMAASLTAYGLTPQELEEDLGRESDLLTFLNLRLRPILPGTDLARNATDESTQKELDRWLRDQYARTRIEYVEKDLDAKGAAVK